MEKLKSLTSQECVDIASIVRPNVKWKLIESEQRWWGFDLIEEGSDERDAKHIFQIDFRELNEMIKIPLGMKPESRFRYYKNLREIPIGNEQSEAVDYYLSTLGCSLNNG